MPDDPKAPADTNMMRIVHTALRRDLRRAEVALTTTPPPGDRQRAAIAEHVGWLMAFLEAHHRSEDLGLFPLVRERETGAVAARIDALARDHEAVAPAIAEVKRAAAAYAERDEREALVVAIDGLAHVLLPHLQREDEMMPVVSRAVTDEEWRAIERSYNLDGKSMSQLGREGHWLIDDASVEDRGRVLALVPPAPRLLLVYGFGPSYRRRTRACWNPQRRRVQHQGSTSVVVPGGIDDVWDVIRDPTRVGEWSHECLDGRWVGDAAEARPGARFRGRNRQGLLRWGRLCEVDRVEPYELVWHTIPTRLYPDSTEWALRLMPVDGGTRIEQTFQVVKGTKLEVVYATVVPAHRDRTDALQRDLERIGALAVAARDPEAAIGRVR